MYYSVSALLIAYSEQNVLIKFRVMDSSQNKKNNLSYMQTTLGYIIPVLYGNILESIHLIDPAGGDKNIGE